MEDVTAERRVGLRGVELVLRLLRNGRREVRGDGLWYARKLGRKAEAAVPTLLEFLAAAKGSARHEQAGAAARALGEIGPAAREALPDLKRAALEGENAAARVLTLIDPEGKEVLSTLIEILEAPSISSPGAFESIQRLGAKAAIPLLEELAAGDRPTIRPVNWEVESAARTALEKIRVPAR